MNGATKLQTKIKIARKSSRKYSLCYKIVLFVARKTLYRIILSTIEAITEGVEAICNNDISTPQDGVIPHNLRQRLLPNLYRGLLALHHHEGLCLAAYGHNIGTLRHTVNCYGVLLDNLLWRKSATRNHKLHDVAAHPLFGCQQQPPAAHRIEDFGAAEGVAACSKAHGRKV